MGDTIVSEYISQDSPRENLIEISPNGSYLVTYTENEGFIEWNVGELGKDIVDENVDRKPVEVHNRREKIRRVSDDKILAYIYDYDIGKYSYGSYYNYI